MKSYREFLTEKTKLAKAVDALIAQTLGKGWASKYKRDDLSTSFNKGDFIVSDRGAILGRLKRGQYDDTKLLNALLGEGYADGDISEREFDLEEGIAGKGKDSKWKMPKSKTGSKPLKKKKSKSGMDDEEPYAPDPKKKKVDEAAGEKTIDIDKIKDKKLNKEAFALLKKGQKAYYSETDQAVISGSDVKKEIGSTNDLFKFTDYKSVVAPGKKY